MSLLSDEVKVSQQVSAFPRQLSSREGTASQGRLLINQSINQSIYVQNVEKMFSAQSIRFNLSDMTTDKYDKLIDKDEKYD